MKTIGGSTTNPYVIHPYYTGRDKGLVRYQGDTTGNPVTFFNAGHAWWYIFNTLQPDDVRAKDNYRVIPLKQYESESL